MRGPDRWAARAALVGLLLAGAPATAGPEAVVLVLEEPAEGAIVPARFPVRGRVQGAVPGPSILRVNGQDVVEDEGRFATTLEAAGDGPLLVRVVRASVGLPAVSTERTVVVDATPPLLELVQPEQEESWHAAGEATISGIASDRHLVAVRMNGQAVHLGNNGLFEAVFLLPSEGSVRVEIEAVDVVGQVARAVRVLRHGAAPGASPSGPAPAAAPQAGTQRAPPDRVIVRLAHGGVVTLLDGQGSVTLDGLRAAGGPGASDALATLRARLAAVEWQPPRGPDGRTPRRRSLVLEAPSTLLWRTAGWLAALPAEEGVRPASVALAVQGGEALEARVPVLDAAAAGPVRATRLVLRAGRAEPQPTTQVDLLTEPLHLPRAEDLARRGERESAVSRLREELRARLRADPGLQGVLAVADPDRVPFADVVLAAKTFADAGILSLRLEPDVTRPAFGTPAPLAPATAAEAGPPPAAAAPLPESAPPPRPDGGAFPLRVERAKWPGLGVPSAVEEAVEGGLAWLAAHQSQDGGWEAQGFAEWCQGKRVPPTPERGRGKGLYDAGVTGLALCAFLGAGHTGQGSEGHARTVRRGLAYLVGVQDGEGCFGPRATQHYIYNHACAALAMVEAYGMTGSPVYLRCAQRALAFIELCRNPQFVWRYGVKPGDSDTSVTGWMMSVLHAADVVNRDAVARGRPPPLRVDPEAVPAVLNWVAKMTDAETGRVGYVTRGSGPARPQELIERFPNERSESMTAVGVLCRLYAGRSPQADPLLERGAALCAGRPPTWNEHDGSLDMYYWFYASQALWLLGGKRALAWDEAVRRALLPRQRRDGDLCSVLGSWDPVDPWGPDGGRVYSTALCVLILETRVRASP